MIKKVVCSIAIIFVLFGLCNAYMALGLRTAEISKIQEPISTSGAEDIAIDSNGNIYLGNPHNYSVQMFDRTGKFISGYKLPTGGGDFLMCIYDDTVYVYMFRTDMEYNIKDGILINTNQTSQDKFEKFYNLHKASNSGRTKIKLLSIVRKVNDGDRDIYIDAPVFPLSLSDSISIFGIGIIILFICFADKLLAVMQHDKGGYRGNNWTKK